MPKQQKRPTAPMTTRIDVGIISQIEQQARAEGLRRNDLVKKLLLNGLQQKKSHPTPVGMHV